jgi:branched-chain amino acid transport system substrate-binding protein
MFDCGTSRLFLDNSEPKYVFRTGLDAAADNIGAVRYLMATKPGVKRVAGIQQNYAWGQESWADFTASLKRLMPDVQVVDQQFPKIFQGSYGTEISALQTRQPDLIHSSFWGGDMEAFVLQANARGLLSRSTPLLTTGESGIDRFRAHAPNGTIIGGRGPFGAFAPDNELNRWFVKSYQERFKTAPTYPSSKMAQAILALKFAIEKAADGKQGVPSKDAIAGALAGATFPSVSGDVRMARANGHQAMQEMIYAEYHFDGKQPQLKNRISFAAECITPPDGTAPLDWIAQDFPGAKCD